MKRRALALVVFGAAVWLAVPQSATGGDHHGPVVPAGYTAGYGMGGDCGGCAAAAPPVQYTTRTITCYRPETRCVQVPVTQMQRIPRAETYTYNVNVPVTTTQKRTVTEYQAVPKTEQYTYTENTTVTEQVKQQVL